MSQALVRPTAMWIDPASCVLCGLCEEFIPLESLAGALLPVTAGSLEAMALCPTGAIRWVEGEEQDEPDRRS